MKTKRSLRRKVGAAAAMASLTLGLGLTAEPASAAVVDNDRPRITASGYDLGLHWSGFGEPIDGANLDWSETNGIVTTRLTGYLYINNNDGECAYLSLVYHDVNHNWMGTDFSGEGCADGNKLNKFWLDEETPDIIASASLDHVTIQLNHRIDATHSEMVGSQTWYNNG
jgi:hypothetical protein